MLALAVLSILLMQCGAEDSSVDHQIEICNSLSSCASCLSKTYCAWCVTKNTCTKQQCGNDNVIYPEFANALLSGPTFCPRIVKPNRETMVASGKKHTFHVKITQAHLNMAFTTWKCKIHFGGKEMTVNAVLLADNVYCEPVVLNNESINPHMDGSVSVSWDYDKAFDGQLPFKVCRCDLDLNCVPCKV